MNKLSGDDIFEPRDHPELMSHFEKIGFDAYACPAPVKIYPPTVAIVAERYRAFMQQESRRLERDDPFYTALLDQMTSEFRDTARFPAPQS